jgi:hypothetical protein
MFAMINLGPILITMAVVAGLAGLVAIGLVVAAVVAVRRALRRRAAGSSAISTPIDRLRHGP